MLKIEHKDQNNEPQYTITGEFDDFFDNDIKLIKLLNKDPFSLYLLNEIKYKVPILADTAFYDESKAVWSNRELSICAEWKNWDSVHPVCVIEVIIKAYCVI